MDVFLSLYVLPDDSGRNTILPFLLAAETEDDAVDLSDAFIEAIESIANPETDPLDMEIARNDVENLRNSVCLLEENEEIEAVTACLREHNPNFEEEVQELAGSVFTVGVTEDSGFSIAAMNLLRNRMASHCVFSSLSVELV